MKEAEFGDVLEELFPRSDDLEGYLGWDRTPAHNGESYFTAAAGDNIHWAWTFITDYVGYLADAVERHVEEEGHDEELVELVRRLQRLPKLDFIGFGKIINDSGSVLARVDVDDPPTLISLAEDVLELELDQLIDPAFPAAVSLVDEWGNFVNYIRDLAYRELCYRYTWFNELVEDVEARFGVKLEKANSAWEEYISHVANEVTGIWWGDLTEADDLFPARWYVKVFADFFDSTAEAEEKISNIFTKLELEQAAKSGKLIVASVKLKTVEIRDATTEKRVHSTTTEDGAHSSTDGDGVHSVTTGCVAHSATGGSYAYAVTTGDGSHSATSGDHAHSVTVGYGSHSASAGDHAHSVSIGSDGTADVIGERACAVALGVGGKVRGNQIGDVLICAWYDRDGILVGAKTATISESSFCRPGRWYRVNAEGEWVEVEKEDSDE